MKQLFHFFLRPMTTALSLILVLTIALAALTSFVPIGVAAFAAIALTLALTATSWRSSPERRGDGGTATAARFWRDRSLMRRIGAALVRPDGSPALA